MVYIESHQLNYIPTVFKPSVKLYVKLPLENFIREYITSSTGVPIPLKDESSNNLIKVSAENIPSYTPIALIDNQAYKLDAGNINHNFSFVGFSINGATMGQNCEIQQIGELKLLGWGLSPNTRYLANSAGSITTDNLNPLNFTKVVGYATTSDTLQIIKDYTSIVK